MNNNTIPVMIDLGNDAHYDANDILCVLPSNKRTSDDIRRKAKEDGRFFNFSGIAESKTLILCKSGNVLLSCIDKKNILSSIEKL